MSIYESVVSYLSNNLSFQVWPELRLIIARTRAKKPRDWKLPVRVCEAVGGAKEQAIPASSAIACVQIGIILIDDMLDDDPRGEYQHIGAAQTANFSSAFQAMGIQAVLDSPKLLETKISALRTLNGMIMDVAYGQYLDAQNASNETAYWHIVKRKSASFFGAALHLGALFGEASVEIAEKTKEIGYLYGEMIQIHDDLNDTMAVPANPDWLQGRSPLPILFAKIVEHPERERFLELCEEVADETALRQAQDILVRCGAVSYCVDQLLRRYKSARELLPAVQLARPELIEGLLEEVIAPVRRLFEAIGESLPASSTMKEPARRA